MPAAVIQPGKTVLADTTNQRRDLPSSPTSVSKKRRYDGSPVVTPASGRRALTQKLGSSQPKSQFETEVLEKLSQDINGLKKANAEKDQQWKRPPLEEDWQEGKDAIIFQQIEAEEGTLHGGKTTIKLFGTTEVISSSFKHYSHSSVLTSV